MGMLKQSTTVLSFALTMLLSFSAYASPMYTTYQAKIIKPDGESLESTNVNFRFTILDPLGTCVLYTENFNTINMTGTGGLVSFSLGSGIKTFPTSGTVNFSDVFNNHAGALSCAAGGPPSYTPIVDDLRKIVMQFNDGNGWQTLPAMNINHVPYAMYASHAASATTAVTAVNSAQLNGKTDLAFVQVTSIPTCSASQALQFNGASFGCVAVGGGGGASYTVTSSDVTSALGYTPANNTTVTTLQSNLSTVSATANNALVKSNNLSDLTNAATARTNLGLGSLATASSLSASDVTTALGYTPQASGAVSSQWATSGTAISYTSGDTYINGLTVGRGGGNDFSNVAFGRNALISNATGWQNVAVGEYAMEDSTGSMQNTAIGSYVLRYDTGSTNNVAVGTYAMENNAGGSYNVAVGVFALDSNDTGSDNVAIGEQALLSNTTGNENVGIGRFSGVFNRTGSSNVLIGNRAGYGASGASNYLNSTVVGYYAGNSLRTAGSNNILLGYKAGDQITTGAKNIVIGYDIDTPTVTTSNSLNIGNLIYGSGLNGSGTTVSTGNIGIGTTNPVTKLSVSGGLQIGMESASCAVSYAGALRYNAGTVEYCNGTTWSGFGGTVTSSSVISALGYTPANSATVAGQLTGVDNLLFASGAGASLVAGGNYNILMGTNAGNSLTTGDENIIIGREAGKANVNGSANLFIGSYAGVGNSGDENTFVGAYSGGGTMGNPGTGYSNAIFGAYAGGNLTDGYQNTMIGYRSGRMTTTGFRNYFGGYESGEATTEGYYNVFIGYSAGLKNTTANNSVALGASALTWFVAPAYSDAYNTAIGADALTGVALQSTGVRNTALGGKAGDSITTGSDNILIGYNTDTPTPTTSNFINIGNTIYGNSSTGRAGVGISLPKEHLHVSGTMLVTGDWGSGPTLAVSGSGTRMFFYPRKASFRGGYAYDDEWNENNIGEASFAFGDSVLASGNYSVAIGRNAKAQAPYATAFGQGEATGDYSAAFDSSTASGIYSFAAGSSSANADRAIAFGGSSSANAESSVAIGRAVIANSYQSIAVGSYNVGGGSATAWVATDPIFEIGNSQNGIPRSNAMTVLKNGNTGLGTTTPVAKLDIRGQMRSVASTGTTFDNTGSTAVNWDNGNVQFTTDSCQAYAMSNLQDGGSYTFVVKGATSAQCSFTAAGLTFHYTPALAATNPATHTMFTMMRVGSDVYVSWITGL